MGKLKTWHPPNSMANATASFTVRMILSDYPFFRVAVAPKGHSLDIEQKSAPSGRPLRGKLDTVIRNVNQGEIKGDANGTRIFVKPEAAKATSTNSSAEVGSRFKQSVAWQKRAKHRRPPPATVFVRAGQANGPNHVVGGGTHPV
jgi:hypothetical protein